jgi:rhodanese-related sulfurtransferase
MLLIDLRSEKSFNKGHLCEAINLPTPLPPLTVNEMLALNADLFWLVYGLPYDHPIGVYCKKGIRASTAVGMLQHFGYTNVVNLGGFC